MSPTGYDDSVGLLSPKTGNRDTSMPATNKFQSYMSNASAINGQKSERSDINNSTNIGSGTMNR